MTAETGHTGEGAAVGGSDCSDATPERHGAAALCARLVGRPDELSFELPAAGTGRRTSR